MSDLPNTVTLYDAKTRKQVAVPLAEAHAGVLAGTHGFKNTDDVPVTLDGESYVVKGDKVGEFLKGGGSLDTDVQKEIRRNAEKLGPVGTFVGNVAEEMGGGLGAPPMPADMAGTPQGAALSPEGQQEMLRQASEKNPTASGLGKVGGFGLGLVAGGGAAHAAGEAAARDVIGLGGGKVLQRAAAGMVGGGVFMAPQATQHLFNGDPEKAAEALAWGMGPGAILGGVGGKLSDMFSPKNMEAAGEMLAEHGPAIANKAGQVAAGAVGGVPGWAVGRAVAGMAKRFGARLLESGLPEAGADATEVASHVAEDAADQTLADLQRDHAAALAEVAEKAANQSIDHVPSVVDFMAEDTPVDPMVRRNMKLKRLMEEEALKSPPKAAPDTEADIKKMAAIDEGPGTDVEKAAMKQRVKDAIAVKQAEADAFKEANKGKGAANLKMPESKLQATPEKKLALQKEVALRRFNEGIKPTKADLNFLMNDANQAKEKLDASIRRFEAMDAANDESAAASAKKAMEKLQKAYDKKVERLKNAPNNKRIDIERRVMPRFDEPDSKLLHKVPGLSYEKPSSWGRIDPPSNPEEVLDTLIQSPTAAGIHEMGEVPTVMEAMLPEEARLTAKFPKEHGAGENTGKVAVRKPVEEELGVDRQAGTVAGKPADRVTAQRLKEFGIGSQFDTEPGQLNVAKIPWSGPPKTMEGVLKQEAELGHAGPKWMAETPQDKKLRSVIARIRDLAADPAALAAITGHLASPLMNSGADNVAAALVQKQHNMVQYLNSVMPRAPSQPLPFTKQTWKPTPQQTKDATDVLHIAEDPMHGVRALRDGSLTPAQVDAMANMYPAMYEGLKAGILAYSADPAAPQLSYKARAKLSLFTKVPLDRSFHPGPGMALQQNRSTPPTGGTNQPKKWKIKGPDVGTNLTHLEQKHSK
jgi:hypothetical protein